MRITEPYKRSGYFWLPANPNRKIPGTLSVSDGGKIELEVVGLFEDDFAAFTDRDAKIDRIVGHVEKDGLVTLDNCFYLKKNFALVGIAKSLVHANLLLAGAAYEDGEQVTFDSVSFSIEGIDEWVGITGIDVEYGTDFRTATIRYAPPGAFGFDLKDGFRLHISFSYTLPGSPVTTEAKVTQRAYLRLSSLAARTLPEFMEVLHKLNYLLCLAVDATVAVQDVSATSDSLTREASDGRRLRVAIKVIYPSLPFAAEPAKVSGDRMLFSFAHIRADAARIFNNWLDAYAVIRPSLGLYFSAATGSHKFLEGRFLALAQALETYHRRTSSETLMDTQLFRSLSALLLCACPKTSRRWLRGRLTHANEISLGTRIKRIIEPFREQIGNARERNRLIRQIVDTRNYLTHYSEDLESQALAGTELWDLCQKMEAIFQLLLLRQLGFSHDEISNVLVRNHKLKQRFGAA